MGHTEQIDVSDSKKASRDITERERTEEQHKSRYEFERLISLISIDFINALNENLHDLIDQALKKIGQFVKAARCSLLIFSEDLSRMTNINEWCIDPNDTQIDLLQNIPSEKFGYYLKLLKEKKEVIINHFDDIPPEAYGEREWVKKYGFRSLMFVPMQYKNKLFGTLGFYGELNVERVWSKDLVNLLKILANIFVNSLARKRTEQNLKESETRFRSLVENTSDWIWETDKNGVFTYSSPKIKELLGFETGDIIGKTPLDFMALNQFGKLKETYLTIVRSQEPYSGLVNLYYHKNGEIIYLETSGVPIFNDDGIFGGFRGFDRNISEDIKANQKLSNSEERYRLITENSNLLISVLNEKFEYEYINENVYWNILGYKLEDLIGKINLELIHPEDRKQTAIALSRIIRKGKGFRQLRIKNKNGTFKWLEVTAKNFYDSKGRKKILTISRDISDRKVIEDSLEKSEQKFRNIVDSIPLGMHMYQVNSEGNLIFSGANTTADKLLNLDNSQFIGKTIENAFPPLKETDIPDRYLEAALKGKSSTWDQVTYEDDKIKGAFEVHAFQTSPRNMVTSFADITERLKTKRNLKESEEKFRTITEQSFMGIGIIQEEEVIYANEAMAKILEYSLDEMIIWTRSGNILNLIHPEDLQTLREQRSKRQLGDINFKPNISYRIITKSGKTKWIDQYSKTIIYHGKEAELISVIDISEKKNAEEIILQENLKLMELNKLREDIIVRVSHELKTPLTSIYGASQVLLNHHKKELNEHVLNLVEISHRGGIRLKKLIENLIDTSKLKWEKLILNKKNEDLVKVVGDCVEEMMFLAKNRNIVIKTDLNNKIFLKVDKLRLEQAITNILSNAIKNTPSHGKIYVTIIENKDIVGINIKDTGIGITLEEKKVLFEKFGKIERYGMDLDVDIEGAGLGLFISKEIVELHGGQIIVESAGRNKGTEVIIELLK